MPYILIVWLMNKPIQLILFIHNWLNETGRELLQNSSFENTIFWLKMYSLVMIPFVHLLIKGKRYDWDKRVQIYIATPLVLYWGIHWVCLYIISVVVVQFYEVF
jgi:hypothetical protein